VSKRTEHALERKPWKLLLWTAFAGIIFGLIGFGEIAEDLLRAGRNSLHWHKASGDIVLVTIDNEALSDVGRWPWPRRYHAQLTDRLTDAGAKRIFFDIGFFGPSNNVDDRLLAQSLKRSGKVVLASRTRGGPGVGERENALPLPAFAKTAAIGSISWRYNYQNAVTRIPYSTKWEGHAIPSFAALLANKAGAPDETFIPDYSVDPYSIPRISAARIISGRFDPKLVRGKQVVIGTASDSTGDQFFLPGTGKMGGVYVHVIGAETLKSGAPLYLGWIPLFLVSLAICFAALTRSKPGHQGVILGAGAALMLFGPAVPEAHQLLVDMTPGLFVIMVIASVVAWRHYRARGLLNPVSNLPNLNALRTNRDSRNQALVATRVLNFEEIVAALPSSGERQLVEQIVSRLKVGAPSKVLYQGDGGIFAWFEETGQPVGNHLEALYALFRNPARIDGQSMDLTIAFGVEIGSGRSVTAGRSSTSRPRSSPSTPANWPRRSTAVGPGRR